MILMKIFQLSINRFSLNESNNKYCNQKNLITKPNNITTCTMKKST